ncbi:AcrB/AcrD/AcrF family protein [Sphingomicrobium sp. XHP0239]|uniref:AcrB/AcrD/AcrF family protein n=1 Tax=Sphingomicrobium maritimum TaxID=3133972 RepID=UPI0031CCA00B
MKGHDATGGNEEVLERLSALLERRWIAVMLFVWLLFANIAIFLSLEPIIELGLRDTDDNLRMVQVRDWLAGQGWFDLEQKRMVAGNLHWSRLVDLPIAGLILLFEPFVGTAVAERVAVMLAPLLAMFVALIGLGLTARRLVGPRSAPLVGIAAIFASLVAATFWPLRIDHHNWQVAALAFVMAGAVDPEKRRGGIVAGIATALSLGIGLEMMIPMALVGAGIVLGWVWRPDEARRMASYGASLALGCGVMFLGFASEANRALMCDVLSPVWTSDMVLAGALAVLLAIASPAKWQARLGLAAAAGAVLAATHALAFPHCLSRLEGVDPAVADLWLNRVSEARGLHEHSVSTAIRTLGPVAVGLVGFVAGWFWWPKDAERRRRLLIVAVPTAVMAALTFWQLRAGTAAQALSLVGAAAFVTLIVPRALASGSALIRVLGTVLSLMAGLNILWLILASSSPKNRIEESKAEAARAQAEADAPVCREEQVLATLDRIAPSTLFAPVDLGPRLLATTHHRVIVGPYHRNDEAIGYVISAFESSDAEEAAAERTVRGLGADYVFVCNDIGRPPVSGEGSLEARLIAGDAPDWLVEEPGYEGLPFRLFAVR